MLDGELKEISSRLLEEEPRVTVAGLSGSVRSFFFAGLLHYIKRPCLVILPDRKEEERLFKELGFFMSERDSEKDPDAVRLREFPPYDFSPLSGLSPHRDVVTSRLEALYSLISHKNPVVVASVEALSFKILPKEAFIRALEYLEAGEEVERDRLIRSLEDTGYQRCSLVEERGDYTVRGGVVDAFPPLYPLPVRLEFWGDHIESIRYFDPVSQRSKQSLGELILLPANEVIMEKENVERARSMGRLPAEFSERKAFPGQEAWLNHFYSSLDSVFDYLPEDAVIALFDGHRAESMCKKGKDKFEKEVEKFSEEAAVNGAPFPETENLFISYGELSGLIDSRQCLDLSELTLAGETGDAPLFGFKGPFELDSDVEIRLAGKGKVSMGPLAEKIASWIGARSRVVLVCRTRQQADRLNEILGNYGIHVDEMVSTWSDVPRGPGLTICLGRLSKGFVWPEKGLYVISEDEIFGSKRARSSARGKPAHKALTWSGLSQLKEGDPVVHEDHGIGKYAGLKKMEIGGKVNDFLVIEYAGEDKLYLPADRIDILQKYVGAGDTEPKRDQLGGRSWKVVKEKAKKSVKKVAKQLLELYAVRDYRKGFSFSSPDNYFSEFEATFEHEETSDQVKAIHDVLEDMMSERPMDRLICGDVGFGKTEIAIRAAFKAVCDGKQVAFLVPTTVLGEQHYETFKKRMEPYSIRVDLLSRFKTRAEQSEILARLRSGKSDILLGTHRMLQKDVKFRDLGLLIIDEEQRFGVKQKELIKRYRTQVDVLAITATPIPRSFQMSMMGLRDLSVIETPPEDRLAIQTYISRYDEGLITRAIKFELERGGQVFFVHNSVQTIDYMADKVRRLVPEARFATAHGQMRGRELEKTMMRFLEKEIDVLICTTIIESGLDIPSANTIIINETDRMGLAQIYQLRGRVGRSEEKAYAYLLVSDGSPPTRQAEKRLKALMDFSHLGAGLHLAMHDLKIRGAGNILGFSQSGHISAIGHELYLKLIERAVAELKGEGWDEEISPEINMDIPAYIPAEYVVDTDVRLNLYRRFSGLVDYSELKEMEEEISDRFGQPPEEVKNLFAVMSLRLLCKKFGINRLDVGSRTIALTPSSTRQRDVERLVSLADTQPEKYRLLPGDKVNIRVGRMSMPEDLPKAEEAIKEFYERL